jgi:hypothetical protein
MPTNLSSGRRVEANGSVPEWGYVSRRCAKILPSIPTSNAVSAIATTQ